MSAVMYMHKLMERDVVQDKFAPCHERAMARFRL